MSTVCAPACRKASQNFFTASDADIFCIQESKLQEGQIDFAPEGYYAYWNYAEKKGYSGTAIFTRKEPLSVHYGIGISQHDTEGRVITLEFPDFFIWSPATRRIPQNELARLSYRMEWEDAFLSYLKGLDRNKPLILCGDLNVAHEEIDLKNPKTNRKNAGFTDEERTKMTALFIRRLHRYVPPFLSGYRGHLLLVVLPLSRQREERRMAYRLLHHLIRTR